MRDLVKPLLLLSFVLLSFIAHAQFDGLFSPFDCREHAELFYNEPVEEPIVTIDSSIFAAVPEEMEVTVDTINGWKQWSSVENFTFGKDRGAMTMITDIRALHPYFRDQIRTLIAA